MAIEFINPITAGTTLVRSDIRSQNYVQGSAGWIIEADGDAEFNSVVIRGGTVVSGTALYYSGTPALGNLFMSIAAAAGTDSFGNPYVKGVGLYGAQGQLIAEDSAGNTATIAGNIGGGGQLAALPGVSFQPNANTGDPATVGALDDGTHTNLSLLLTSPSPVVGGLPGTDFSQINMIGSDSAPTQIYLDASVIGFNSATTMNSSGIVDSYASNTFTSYTPTITGGGTATLATASGWYQRIGRMIMFGAHLVIGNAGSGAATVTVSLPIEPSRGTDQIIPLHGVSVFSGGLLANGHAVVLTSGSGTRVDGLRMSNNAVNNADATVSGADLNAGAIIILTGWYREI